MTTKRRDSHSTEFGLWLREQDEIDSELGFYATNIDYVWRRRTPNAWMYLEEKRHDARIPTWQRISFQIIHRSIVDPSYRGFWCLFFEKTNPDDGKVWLCRLPATGDNTKRHEISEQQLIAFLRFEHHEAFS